MHRPGVRGGLPGLVHSPGRVLWRSALLSLGSCWPLLELGLRGTVMQLGDGDPEGVAVDRASGGRVGDGGARREGERGRGGTDQDGARSCLSHGDTPCLMQLFLLEACLACEAVSVGQATVVPSSC